MKGADFIFFWHGFALLLFGTALFLRRRRVEGDWRRFNPAIFCFLLGLSEWVALFSWTAGPGYNLHLLRFILFVSAFIFLFESVRTAAARKVRWFAVYPVCAVLTGAAYFSGIDPVLAGQYIAAVPSLLLAALVLRRNYSKYDNPAKGWPWILIHVFYVYALLWMVPAPGCRLPLFLDSHALTGNFVMYAAVIRAFCISAGFVIILLKRHDYFFKIADHAWRFWLTSACAGILIATFIFSTFFMTITENDMRSNLTAIVRGIAMGINPDRIEKLTFSAEDSHNPAFNRIRDQMKYWGRYMGLRYIYSMKMKEGKLFFGPENIEENDPMSSAPGTEYLKPPRAFIDAWISGQSGAAGPYTDEYGSFVSGYAPVFDRISGRVLMIVAVDYDVSLWMSGILRARATSFVPFMIISLCLLFWLVMFNSRRESLIVHRSFFYRNIEAVCCLATGIILTCIVSFYMNFFEKRVESREFHNLADSWSNIIRSIITDSRYHTEELSLYLENSEEVTWDEFRGFYSGKNILPYISIAWYPAVKAADAYSFVSYMRGQGFRDYRITNRAGDTGPGNGVYYPLAYIVPLEYGKKELGSDIAEVPEIRDALETGLLTMMKQDREEALSTGGDMVLLNPVSKKGKNIGFVRSVIDLEHLLSRVISFRNSINLGIMVDIADIGNDGSSRILLSYPHTDAGGLIEKDKPSLSAVYPVFYSGHTLCVKLYLSEGFIGSRLRIAGPVSFALGMLFSTGAAILAGYLIFRRNSLEDEIKQRTRELGENEERYRIVS